MSFPQPPENPGSPFNPTASGGPGPQPGPVPQQEAWGQSPNPGVPIGQPQKKPMGKPLIAALCTGLFLTGCVSGCVTGAAMVDGKSAASPAPTVTVTATASATESAPASEQPTDTPSAAPSESAPEPTSEAPAPAAPAPEAPAPQAPDPNSLTQQVENGTITITPFAARMDEFTGKQALLCTTVTAVNTSKDTWSVNPLEFELSTPEHKRINAAIFTGGQTLGHSELIAGDTVAGDVCFEDPGTRGQFTLIWGPFFKDSTRWTVQIP